MAEIQSFGKLVVCKAIANTIPCFKSRSFDISLGMVSISFASGAWYLARGRGEAMTESLIALAALFGSFTFMVVGVFVWNLWLAPAALAYEVLTTHRETSAPTELPASPAFTAPDYKIWRLRDSYTIRELSALLDGLEPAQTSRTAAAIGFERLLLEQVKSGKLTYISNYIGGRTGGFTMSPDIGTMIPKQAAITWAENNGLSDNIAALR